MSSEAQPARGAATDAPRLLRAAAWIAGTILSFSAMMVGGRELAPYLSTFEILAWRSLIGLPIALGALLWVAGPRGLLTAQPGLHALRNVIHFGAQNLWFFGVAVVPLAQLVTLEFTNPIWVALLAPALLGEPLTRAKMLAAGLGFAGVLVIAQPGAGPLHLGHAAALGAAIGFALTNIATKRLSRQDSALTVLFWMIASQTAMGFAVAIPMGLSPIPPEAWPWVLLVAATGLSAHFCLTSALFTAPASVVGPMEFARLPVVALTGMLLYGEAVGLGLLLGAALILTGNAVNIRSERLSRAPAP